MSLTRIRTLDRGWLRLGHLTPWQALALGLALGAILGLVTLVWIGGLIGVVLCVPVLGLAVWLGFNAGPVVEIVPPREEQDTQNVNIPR